ncbi:MAG TPA: alkaline phosphatase D family protein [Gemmatimonadota bacterium]|nr:alkaline phosphatase D family protein [Gemmatimonadota bacterium]
MGEHPATGPTRVVLGPMVGHVTESSARIWVELDRPGRLSVELTDAEGETERGVADARGFDGGIALVDVTDLDPGTSYRARLSVDGMQVTVDPPLEIRTFPRPAEPSRVRIVLVSCARVGWDSIQSSWAAVAAERPDAVLWLGDNGYLEHADSVRPADYTSAERIEHRYREMRGLPAVQPVLRTTANYAIWDDRDYGDSDSDRTSPSRLAVAEIFERYWANPSYGVEPGFDGIYARFRIGAAEVFLIDDRFWRDPDSLPDSPDKTILGNAQKEWLKRSLDESDAALKIVAIGHQVLADYHEWESYAMFAYERREILDWIRERRIEGVIFVDGDRHLSELMRDDRAGLYPLYELTASPIANRPFVTGLELPNPIRIGGYAAGYSYGVLELDTTKPPGRLTFLVKDAEGVEVMRHEVTLSDLRFQE